MQKVRLIRDSIDWDKIHVYTFYWSKPLRERRSIHAASVHVDAIEDLFGPEVATEFNEWDDLEVVVEAKVIDSQ